MCLHRYRIFICLNTRIGLWQMCHTKIHSIYYGNFFRVRCTTHRAAHHCRPNLHDLPPPNRPLCADWLLTQSARRITAPSSCIFARLSCMRFTYMIKCIYIYIYKKTPNTHQTRALAHPKCYTKCAQ